MGLEYNCDVYFSYDLGSGESDFYDDTLSQSIVLNNGGDIIFKVSPYFVGFNGTYLLNLKISRSKINSLSKVSFGDMVDLFPNPARDLLYIKLMDKTSSISEIAVKNQLGESISVMAINKNEEVTALNTTLLPTGIYFLQIKSNGRSAVNKKFVISR